MTLYEDIGDEELSIDDARLWQILTSLKDRLGERKKILILPPDISRFHSKAGKITRMLDEMYGDAVKDIMPALGTHDKMTDEQKERMFGSEISKGKFRDHDWRNDVVTIGNVDARHVAEASRGYLNEPWPVELNRLVWEGGHDLIVSVGQVVPHEVMGMSNYNKNLFVGTGGKAAINLSHFIGALYGIEAILGIAENPLRSILNIASDTFLANRPVVYILTVVRKEGDQYPLSGLYIGDDVECFRKACALSKKINITQVPRRLDKVVAYLSPEEFQSTWLGNKAIYRTRKALADNATLYILAPGISSEMQFVSSIIMRRIGVRRFGEDDEMDALIRKYGYRRTPEILDFAKKNYDLRESLGAAAHLIHGTSEGRFRVIYCCRHLTREEVEGVGYEFADYDTIAEEYPVDQLRDGWNTTGKGEVFYYISNPALGLWEFHGDET